MTTTNSLIDLPMQTAKLSTWQKIKKNTLALLESSPVLQLLCCLDVSEIECHRTNELVRSEIRDNMRMHMGYGAMESCVEHTINEVWHDTGYDLSNGGVIAKANVGVKRTEREWDAYFAKLGIDPLEYLDAVQPAVTRRCEARTARIVPKFAAACSLHIRAKLGILQNNEANVLLVQRKYLEVCRRMNVRDVDIIMHQQFVINTVFTEDVLDKVATVQRRLPSWVKWLDSVATRQAVNPTVC